VHRENKIVILTLKSSMRKFGVFFEREGCPWLRPWSSHWKLTCSLVVHAPFRKHGYGPADNEVMTAYVEVNAHTLVSMAVPHCLRPNNLSCNIDVKIKYAQVWGFFWERGVPLATALIISLKINLFLPWYSWKIVTALTQYVTMYWYFLAFWSIFSFDYTVC
jgi:hypothetical protein